MHDSSSEGSKQSEATSPGLWRLALCATGICACYLYYGLLFENLFQPGEHALGATFVLMTQSITNSVVAFGWQKFQDNSSSASSTSTSTSTKNPLPHRFLFAATACYVTAMACSNEAVRYVSYPVAVLAKSCKLIPTMLVGQFVEGRLYSRTEWTAALCISAGIVLFHMTRMEVAHIGDQPKPTASYGMLLLLVSLTVRLRRRPESEKVRLRSGNYLTPLRFLLFMTYRWMDY